MMLKESAIFSIVHLVVLFCSTTNALLARPTSDAIGQSYIVGGKNTDIVEFPYQVAIVTNDHKLWCGGSIISQKHVLTSCYCAGNPNIAYVRAGSSTWGSGGTTRKIRKIVKHEKCDLNTLGFSNDIAIVTVDKDFGPGSKAIKLSERLGDFTAGTLSKVTGYGTISGSTESPEHLKVVEVPMKTRTSCNIVYKDNLHWLAIGEDRVCAGKDEGGSGPCEGDLGGPLVVKTRQIGIFSYSNGCAKPNVPAVYTKVAYFSSWIKKHTRS